MPSERIWICCSWIWVCLSLNRNLSAPDSLPRREITRTRNAASKVSLPQGNDAPSSRTRRQCSCDCRDSLPNASEPLTNCSLARDNLTTRKMVVHVVVLVRLALLGTCRRLLAICCYYVLSVALGHARVLCRACGRQLLPSNGYLAQTIQYSFIPLLSRWILHDWSDDDCVKILKQCRKAIPEHTGKVILVEVVLQCEANEDAWEDIKMVFDVSMIIYNFGGKERTEAEWRKLLKM
ncbi:hypothetical protein EJ110_NYTH21405 [Nymphaea thermarum]|nr:hypothetical protein EJ110_NYTH21405 [Nymphaea thermarum]